MPFGVGRGIGVGLSGPRPEMWFWGIRVPSKGGAKGTDECRSVEGVSPPSGSGVGEGAGYCWVLSVARLTAHVRTTLGLICYIFFVLTT